MCVYIKQGSRFQFLTPQVGSATEFVGQHLTTSYDFFLVLSCAGLDINADGELPETRRVTVPLSALTFSSSLLCQLRELKVIDYILTDLFGIAFPLVAAFAHEVLGQRYSSLIRIS